MDNVLFMLCLEAFTSNLLLGVNHALVLEITPSDCSSAYLLNTNSHGRRRICIVQTWRKRERGEGTRGREGKCVRGGKRVDMSKIHERDGGS